MGAKMYKKYAPLFNLLIFLIIYFFIFAFFAAFKVILAPLLLSVLLAYFLDPIVKNVEEKIKWGRPFISFSIIVIFIILVIGLFSLVIPIIVNQFNNFMKNLPELIDNATKSTSNFTKWLDNHFKLPSAVKINFAKELEKEILKFLSGLSSFIPSIFSNIYSIILSILYLILIPIFSFYLLKELPYIKDFLEKLVPPRIRPAVKEKVNEVNEVVSTFVRGQFIISAGLAVAYSIGLSIIGLPFAILIGIIAGLGDIVPYLGTLFGVLLSVIVALFYFHTLKSVLLVILVFAVIKIVEDWFVYPKLIGDRVGVHPVIIILIIIFAGEYFGITGMILSIPFAGVLKIFLRDIYEWYRESFLYNKEVEILVEDIPGEERRNNE